VSTDLPPIPPGPADTTHPRRALARLALSYAYADAADFAAGGVPTVSDEYSDPWDYVDHAARLLVRAQDVLARAVVYAHERGGSWTVIAEALEITVDQARDQYSTTVDRWEDALDRPWERAGRFLASRMPEGTTDPDHSAANLDRWCLRHLDEHTGTRHNARHDGIEDHMVSANLPRHTPVSEIASLTRTATNLIKRGTRATESERDAYEIRKKALLAKLNQAGTKIQR
jgi:hypothetical protein